MLETIEDYKRELSNVKRQLDVALGKLDVYENEDMEKEGYYVYKSFVRQQMDVVKEFKLREEITKNPKDDKFYDRVKEIGQNLNKAISDLSALRIELKINVKDDQNYKKRITTPESIADVYGDTAGQKS